jgi:uncharacterized protein (TIGR04255 family)
MEAVELAGPFDHEHVSGVKLARAPLASVLFQVRHQDLARLSGEAGEAAAQRMGAVLADSYPYIAKQQEMQVSITGGEANVVPSKASTWKLSSEGQHWQVSLNPGFLSLQTNQYDSRTDFRRRLAEVVEAYSDVAKSPTIERVGLRYVNRIHGDDLDAIGELIRPEMLGPYCAGLPQSIGLQHMLSQALYVSEDISLQVQWGKLPPGATFDVFVPPLDDACWIIDIDAFCMPRPEKLDQATLDATLVRLADVAYTFFRWTVTSAFLYRFGGES